MNLSLWPYLALTTMGYGLVYPGAALLRLAGKDRRGLSQRLGRLEPGLPRKNGPRIWMQAVSVGEVHLAAGLLAELKNRKPGLDLVLSTTTRDRPGRGPAAYGRHGQGGSFSLRHLSRCGADHPGHRPGPAGPGGDRAVASDPEPGSGTRDRGGHGQRPHLRQFGQGLPVPGPLVPAPSWPASGGWGPWRGRMRTGWSTWG